MQRRRLAETERNKMVDQEALPFPLFLVCFSLMIATSSMIEVLEKSVELYTWG